MYSILYRSYTEHVYYFNERFALGNVETGEPAKKNTQSISSTASNQQQNKKTSSSPKSLSGNQRAEILTY